MELNTSIRLSILSGNLPMPTINNLQAKYGEQTYYHIQRMFTAMWRAYLAKGPGATINLPYWARQIRNPKAHNIALKVLADNNWITVSSRPNNNWSEASLNHTKLLDYVTKDELVSIRKYRKFDKYKLTNTKVEEDCAYLTKVRGEVFNLGHNQQGFMLAGKTQFQFDTKTLHLYRDEILPLINKGIEKMSAKYPSILTDKANYAEVGKDVVDTLIYENGTYNSGNRTSDPRGRDNAGYLNKICNPVGFKVMRSLLVIPEANRNLATYKGLIAKYLFIAELSGFREGTLASKREFGMECYNNRFYHDESKQELAENLWLSNTYDDIEAYLANRGTYKWKYPIEIDMSASVLGFLGLLLNHKPFLERTNMIGDTLDDAWGHKVITNRDQMKTVMRQIYGSQASPDVMWRDMDIDYTPEEVVAFRHELAKGEFAVANAFKDFIINNIKPKAEMFLDVAKHKSIHTTCNKHFNHGDRTITYDLYDQSDNAIHRIHHTETVMLPDLQAFKRYFVTGLIHGLDNQPINQTCIEVYNQFGWVLPIHDALILCAESAPLARQTFATELESIHTNRNQILEDYFASIGIGADKMQQWNETVKPLIQPFEGTFKCNLMVLK